MITNELGSRAIIVDKYFYFIKFIPPNFLLSCVSYFRKIRIACHYYIEK